MNPTMNISDLSALGALLTTAAMNTKPHQTKNVSIEHTGEKIILPIYEGKPMAYDTAIEWLKRKQQEENEEFSLHNEIPCAPLDGLVAFHRALAEKYGWTNSIPTPGFFGPKPPTMIGIPISETETMNVAYGRIEIPGLEGYLETGMDVGGKTPKFLIRGKVKKKHDNAVKEIVALTKQFLRERSIYRGKAVKIDFSWRHGDNGYNPTEDCPKFMPTNGVNESDLIFGDKVLGDLKIGLFTPIERTEACRKNGVPLKRGVLLYGPYGTGKTMTASVTALKAVRNGWTFVYLKDVRDLADALIFAAQYAPAVIFAEDVDRAMSGERSSDMDEVLNTLDGVDTKGAEIITVLTTNHIEKINPAALRMGRLDSLIEVSPPDAKAASKLVQLYARGLLEKDADLAAAGKELAGNIPAFIREVTERAKIAAISRVDCDNIEGKVLGKDIITAARAMKPHLELLAIKKDTLPRNIRIMAEVPAERLDEIGIDQSDLIQNISNVA